VLMGKVKCENCFHFLYFVSPFFSFLFKHFQITFGDIWTISQPIKTMNIWTAFFRFREIERNGFGKRCRQESKQENNTKIYYKMIY
jgi:hypothetical protein